ncbi:MAG: DUF1810 domain-containing protein [Pyrinomonadaceae bacterium]
MKSSDDDPFKLERFVKAQDPEIQQVKIELANGSKHGHWMWFVFPQIRGLGSSNLSQIYAISSINEAKAFLVHPVLGARLIECSKLVVEVDGRTAVQVFGKTDAMKFHSSMTLFCLASPETKVFRDALNKYFEGELDKSTTALV